MSKYKVGFWLYQNGGGEQIQQKLIAGLQEREIEVVTGLDLSLACSENGSILCKGQRMEELDLYYSYNAGEQTQYQVYLYEILDRLIPIINNYSAFSLTEDKFKTSLVLRRNGIRTPDFQLCPRHHVGDLKQVLQRWGGRAVYKPTDGWGGMGIVRLDNDQAIDMLQPLLNQIDMPHLYVEEYIKNDHTDYRIDIVDGEYIGCYGRKALKGQWKTNITSGGHVILREPDEEVIELAKKAARATGLEIAGVDLIYDQEREEYVVLEVNGIPAFATPEQEALGLDFNQKKINAIVNLIERTVQGKHYRQAANQNLFDFNKEDPNAVSYPSFA